MGIKVIGVTESGINHLPALYLEWIDECERLIGGERLLEQFPLYKGEKIAIKSGLKVLVETLQNEPKETVILASGDPLFFGIGGYLASKLAVDIYPSVSSIQQAFAKMKESWQDCEFISVHGRSMKGLVQKVDGRKKVCLLTDNDNTPAAIASYLLTYDMNEYEAFVAEELGSPAEKTSWMTLEDMALYEANPLNVVILFAKTPRKRTSIGIPDEEFIQRKPDKGLITKKEVRVLSLSELQLDTTSIVWDIGTCTGSVAIEAAKIARDGAVFAIEKNEADVGNCLQNQKRFRTDFTVVHAKAPAGLEQFQDPDAVFLGGTGGEMKEVLTICANRLRENGRIVLNAVTIETLYEAVDTLKSLGLHVTILLAQISRSKPILHMTRFEGLNPVYIITARKGVH
ncbi:precorrin-6y C5,15-methyltransferase (decarboxylating) subunit CbiE [Bacillus alkalicellulosilyticus]|uniref:precorrin-6y C5,15-methyltransferase (decarboxylating) subunit CbiE n=1 Tax=Alkalihalobacterium alkalicellulosilyticum TaxID=1912214 RepID=UPI0009973193|nr:precorrin-6y C5,15-methyltransferase (decarboxylating) subunit CbiE [Bacillus alkalicellulosilyticus]